MKLALAGLGMVVVLIVSPGLAYLTQPWSAFWIGEPAAPVSVSVGGGLVVPSDPGISLEPPSAPVVSVPVGRVSDNQRFALITAAGASKSVGTIMTALSIAENGSGDPTIISKPNRNGSVDVGMWQDNSNHIGECGIKSIQWLQDAWNNAVAALCILGPSLNYCAWSTYEASCGPGHNSAYRAFLGCATRIAEGSVCQH